MNISTMALVAYLILTNGIGGITLDKWVPATIIAAISDVILIFLVSTGALTTCV